MTKIRFGTVFVKCVFVTFYSMKDKRTIEFYINNKLYKTCPYNKWDETANYISSMLTKGGYFEVYNEHMARELNMWKKKVYVNPQTFKCIVYSSKINTGHVDKFGNTLYNGDTVKTPYGFDSELNEHFIGPNKYYVRESFGNYWTCKDYDVTDFNELEKVKDVIDSPKEQWVKPEKITIKDF